MALWLISLEVFATTYRKGVSTIQTGTEVPSAIVEEIKEYCTELEKTSKRIARRYCRIRRSGKDCIDIRFLS